MTGANVTSIVLLLVGLYDLFAGLLGMIQGKIYINAKNYTNRYTEESLLRFARPFGLVNVLLGLSIAAGSLCNLRDFAPLSFFNNINRGAFYGVLAGLCVLAIVILVIAQKKLVKK